MLIVQKTLLASVLILKGASAHVFIWPKTGYTYQDRLKEERPPYGENEDSKMNYAWLDDQNIDWQKALRKGLAERD